jgi:hypothetical protein
MSAAALLAIFKGLLQLANTVAGFFQEHQLLEAGKAIQNGENLQRVLGALQKAEAARLDVERRLQLDPSWLPDNDPNRRD